jgi:zinc transporter ZupT
MNTSSGSEGEDPMQEARAYNNSIYFMVAMPYLLLGAAGFMIYRGYKRNAPSTGNATSEGVDRSTAEPPT